MTNALRVAWEATDRLCSKRLHPFLPELIKVLRRYGEGTMTAEEVALVSHCGESAEGFYLTTLSAVDVASVWSDCIGVWGKGQERVGAAVHRVRQRLPFSLPGLDSDNGSEFINHHLYTYCRREGITFTRSRSNKKNDSCHVEQKNWSVVRRLVGYDRYSSRAALEALNRVYGLLRLHVNFFQPVMKLVAKTRHGANVRKVYDRARTPHQRLLENGVITEANQQQLAAMYHGLNPVSLLKQNKWELAAPLGSGRTPRRAAERQISQ